MIEEIIQPTEQTSLQSLFWVRSNYIKTLLVNDGHELIETKLNPNTGYDTYGFKDNEVFRTDFKFFLNQMEAERIERKKPKRNNNLSLFHINYLIEQLEIKRNEYEAKHIRFDTLNEIIETLEIMKG